MRQKAGRRSGQRVRESSPPSSPPWGKWGKVFPCYAGKIETEGSTGEGLGEREPSANAGLCAGMPYKTPLPFLPLHYSVACLRQNVKCCFCVCRNRVITARNNRARGSHRLQVTPRPRSVYGETGFGGFPRLPGAPGCGARRGVQDAPARRVVTT